MISNMKHFSFSGFICLNFNQKYQLCAGSRVFWQFLSARIFIYIQMVQKLFTNKKNNYGHFQLQILSYLCTKSVIQNMFYDYIINLSVIDHKIYFILKSIVKWSFIITICHFLDNAHFKFFEQAIEGCIRGLI